MELITKKSKKKAISVTIDENNLRDLKALDPKINVSDILNQLLKQFLDSLKK